MAKYGTIVAAYNLSGGASFVYLGGTIEKGIVFTDKGWARRYTTKYYSPGFASPSGALGVTAIYPVKDSYLPTFSDWQGAMVGFSGSYDFISANTGFTSTYWAVGAGLSVAPESLSFPVMSDTKLPARLSVPLNRDNESKFERQGLAVRRVLSLINSMHPVK